MRMLFWAAVATVCLFIFGPVVAALADTVQTVATAPGPVETTTTTQVSLPIGDWLAGASELIFAVTTAVIAFLMRELPGNIAGWIKTLRLDQLLEKAITYAINATAEAEKGQVLKVDVGNQVLATAVQYAIDHAPKLAAWAGGKDGIAQKILARLDLEASAGVAAPPSVTTILKPVASPRAG